jgi:mono/diheme cytochrome c family protein
MKHAAWIGWMSLAATLAGGTVASGQSEAGSRARPIDVPEPPLPPLPPAPPPQPRSLVRPTTNSLIPPRPMPMPATNPWAVPRSFPATRATNPPPVLRPFPLVFDAESKTADAELGQTNITFTFKLTNTSTNEVRIDQVRASCGCTVPKLPATPWILPPGTNGEFQVLADLRGKRGLFSKMVYVYTSMGFKALNVRVNVPTPTNAPSADRLRNMQLAVTDRQAVFRADCAKCHSDPGIGKKGRELYQSVCGVCHEAEHRATMVPNLRNLNHPTDADHWRTWITHGKAGTLMPAFAQTEGGPLTAEQIDSLVDFLVGNIPSRPASAPLVAPVTRPIPAPTAPPATVSPATPSAAAPR